jgi:hypothetical protein
LKRSALNITACAQATHEANRAYCRSQGDNSQVAWDFAPDWQRLSALAGVLNGNTPEQSRENWMASKRADG